MVAVISKQYGLQYIELAEDIVSETFLVAAETWGMKGIPQNPAAWLYTVAKNRTLYHFRRSKIYENKVMPELTEKYEDHGAGYELDFSIRNIKDSQLQMMFAICHPVIANESQIGLALRILCGFGIDEIAEAFLTSKETINKRLYRAKEKLRAENIKLELPGENEIAGRLDNVLLIIYLLFNEGYYSKTQNQILRKDLCLEAMRLGLTLTENKTTDLPKTNALIALMCFHASRFNARESEDGSLILYRDQKEELWDKELIDKGIHFLNLSAQGNEISSYHLEARIAYWHCIKEDSQEKWKEVLQLYDQLLLVKYSHSVALNRIYALYKVEGVQAALAEAEKLGMEKQHYPKSRGYFLLLGELYKNIDSEKAKVNFQKALSLAKTDSEKDIIREKIKSIAYINNKSQI